MDATHVGGALLATVAGRGHGLLLAASTTRSLIQTLRSDNLCA